MDNNINDLNKSAEEFVKTSTDFVSKMMSSLDSLKGEIMKNPEHAKIFNEQLKNANLNDKIKDINNILNSFK